MSDSAAYSEFLATFGDLLADADKNAVRAAHEQPDPCARLTVTPVAGGMPDAPLVKHGMQAVRDRECDSKRCHHTPRCTPMFVMKCSQDSCDPSSDCHPADHAAFYADRAGIRSRGTVAPFKRMSRGTYAPGTTSADTGRTFNSTDSTVTRKRAMPRYPREHRHTLATLVSYTDGWTRTQLARMHDELTGGEPMHSCNMDVCYRH